MTALPMGMAAFVHYIRNDPRSRPLANQLWETVIDPMRQASEIGPQYNMPSLGTYHLIDIAFNKEPIYPGEPIYCVSTAGMENRENHRRDGGLHELVKLLREWRANTNGELNGVLHEPAVSGMNLEGWTTRYADTANDWSTLARMKSKLIMESSATYSANPRASTFEMYATMKILEDAVDMAKRTRFVGFVHYGDHHNDQTHRQYFQAVDVKSSGLIPSVILPRAAMLDTVFLPAHIGYKDTLKVCPANLYMIFEQRWRTDQTKRPYVSVRYVFSVYNAYVTCKHVKRQLQWLRDPRSSREMTTDNADRIVDPATGAPWAADSDFDALRFTGNMVLKLIGRAASEEGTLSSPRLVDDDRIRFNNVVAASVNDADACWVDVHD